MKQTIILGIDPGLETTGFGVVAYQNTKTEAKDFGVFVTKKRDTFPDRLHQIACDTAEIIRLWKPDVLAIEKLVFVKNVTNGLLVAQARGVIVEQAAAKGIRVVEVAPTEVKKSVTGNGQAPKIQVQNMVQMILKLPETPKPDDAADALAVAITAGQSLG